MSRFSYPPYLDWRAVGPGFCGDVPGRKLEDIAGSISEWRRDDDTRFTIAIPVENGIAKYRDPPLLNSGVTYEVDLLRGAYPIKFDFTPAGQKPGYSRWTVTVEKFHDEYLPESASLECSGEITDLKFHWLMVNEPLEGGKVACERLAKRCSLPLDDSAR